MSGNSGDSGSFTLQTTSLLPHTSSAFSTISAPAALNSSSGIPEPTPAPFCTSTLWPDLASAATEAGMMPTRFSRGLISVGQPTITGSLLESDDAEQDTSEGRGQVRLRRAACDALRHAPAPRPGFLTVRVRPSTLAAW